MRQVTYRVVGAFNAHRAARLSNTESTGKALYLHGNKIAEHREDGLWVTNAGWSSNTTKERLNGIEGVSVNQKNFTWYLNGKEWNGGWVRVSDNEPEQRADGRDGLRTIGAVAALGAIFHQGDEKGANDWKARMLKAGLEGRGLIMPEDWDTLPEAEKTRRLDGAIGELVS